MLRLFQYYIGGIFLIYYNITWGWGGVGVFATYYNTTIGGEGSTRTPNLYYVINRQPLTIQDSGLIVNEERFENGYMTPPPSFQIFIKYKTIPPVSRTILPAPTMVCAASEYAKFLPRPCMFHIFG